MPRATLREQPLRPVGSRGVARLLLSEGAELDARPSPDVCG